MKSYGFFAHAAKLTGTEMHPDTWLDGRNKQSVLRAQTVALASTLRAGGWEPLRRDPARIWLVGICTGEAEEVTQWRNSNMLPVVACLNRRAVLKHATCFLERHRYTRYAVVTCGARCTVAVLRARLQSLARAVSKWAARAAAEWDIRVSLRASEVTVQRGPDGWTYHPHANVLFEPAHLLSCETWSAFLKWSHEVLPGHWRECGRLVDASEAIKYPFKPADLAALPASELGVLAVELHGLKLIQPLGEFAAFLKDLDARGVKLAKVPQGETWAWCEVKRLKGRARNELEAEIKRSVVNKLLCVLSPRPHFVPRMEPCALIMNYTGNLSEALNDTGISDALEASREAWRLMSTPARQLSTAPDTTACVSPRPPPQHAARDALEVFG